eukprot:15433077-Alexandrium_andersonii.AAC.1
MSGWPVAASTSCTSPSTSSVPFRNKAGSPATDTPSPLRSAPPRARTRPPPAAAPCSLRGPGAHL